MNSSRNFFSSLTGWMFALVLGFFFWPALLPQVNQSNFAELAAVLIPYWMVLVAGFLLIRRHRK
jgi:hypothetical protein